VLWTKASRGSTSTTLARSSRDLATAAPPYPHDEARTAPRGGLADKRRAILAGALTVFARDGYTRASIDAISAQAGVSTRTIYNHFLDKAQLFQSVIQESAARVAEAQIAIVDRYLRKVTDLEADLTEFGRAWVTPMPDYADHFALVRQINAEAGHIPQAAIDAWQETGPVRVRHELARRLARLADAGLLHIDDPERAAHHFALLVSARNPSLRGGVSPDEEIAENVTSGVRAFLHGHLPRSAPSG
jgi:AcrR family transcriptional regulator